MSQKHVKKLQLHAWLGLYSGFNLYINLCKTLHVYFIALYHVIFCFRYFILSLTPNKAITMSAVKHVTNPLWKRLVKLPYTTTLLDKTNICIQRMNISEFDEVFDLFTDVGDHDDGYSKWEMRHDHLNDKLSKSEVLTMRNADNNELMVALPFLQSPACRSTKTMLCTAQSVVNPKYRGQGIVFEMYKVGQKFSMDIGFLGFNARAYIIGRNIIPTRRLGALVTGVIPYCSYTDKMGAIDDVLLAKDYKLNVKAPEYYKV